MSAKLAELMAEQKNIPAIPALRIANDRINSGEVELTAEDFTGRDIRRWNN